jgi:SulP family sulfate permease
MSQVPELINVPWLVYPLVVLGLVIVFGLPKLTRAVPAPLVAIVVLTLSTILASVAVPTGGDKGDLPESLMTSPIPAPTKAERRGARAWRTSSPVSPAAWAVAR